MLGAVPHKEMMERVVNLEEDGTEELAHALYEYYQTTTPRMTKITSICWERGLDLLLMKDGFARFRLFMHVRLTSGIG